MNKKIFRSSFFIVVFVLVSSTVLVMGVLYVFFEKQILKELKNEAGFISYTIKNEGIPYIENSGGNSDRITLVAPDGTVLFDNLAPAAGLDNHSGRKEIKEALENGSGTSIRYSDTLMEKTIYYAQKMEDGNILRISATQYSVVALLSGVLRPLTVVLVIALCLSYLLSRRVSEKITGPVNNLDLENPSDNDTYEELTPLLSKISAQKRTICRQLKEAKQKQEEFNLITENMQEGFIVIDNQTNLLAYNQSAVNFLGIDINEVKTGSVLVFNRLKGFRKAIESALNGNRAENTIVLDGHHYNLIANPVSEDGKTIGAVIIILDITERAKREQLRREFTSNVSHELKTPLTSISGFAEILKSGGNSEETVIDFSKSVYDEAQRLVSLVNDIIKLSELDEGSVQFEKEETDLYQLCGEIIKRLKTGADKRGISMHLTGDMIKIYGVRKILDEMIYNLCDNAIKYNKDNGNVDIILSATNKNNRITVRDTGTGIPLADQQRVFERFYRVDKSHSKAVGGTGLGLSIVKHGAIYHNAQISLESAEGKGTSITISFPLQDSV